MQPQARVIKTAHTGRGFRRAVALVCGLAALLLGSPVVSLASAEDAVEGEPTSIGLPHRIARVWSRTAKKAKGLPGGRVIGELTLTPHALEFLGNSDKKSFSIPMTEIRVVSFGKMKGDVDTDWAVLEVERDDGGTLVGLRDGRRMGYGARTREIYEAILEAVRQVGAAQYDVPQGFATYDELDAYFTLAYPAGRSTSHREVIQTPDQVLGVLEFVGQDDEASVIQLERTDVEQGMSAKGFSEKARARLLESALESPLLDAGHRLIAPPLVEPARIDRREGLRVLVRTRNPGGSEILLDQRFFVDASTLYRLALRCPLTRQDSELETIEAMTQSFRFNVARHESTHKAARHGMD